MDKSTDLTSIGGKIRYQRKLAEMTQAELGMKAFRVNENSAQVRIKNFELGIGRVPTDKEIQSICAALNIDIEILAESKEIKTSSRISLDSRASELFPWLLEYINMANLAIEQNDIHLIMRIASRVAERFQESVKEWANANKENQNAD
jgi:transcriptional regulator with XRE-family HTH domain